MAKAKPKTKAKTSDLGLKSSDVGPEKDGTETNPIDAYAKDHGWTPLRVEEQMIVSFGKKQYYVERMADKGAS